jgi:4-hydroxybenzoate polyprenyltransferase
MNSEKAQAVIRALLFILSVMTVIGALLSLAGVPIGLSFVFPLGLVYLLLYLLRLQEWIGGKQKAPGRADRPGASGG